MKAPKPASPLHQPALHESGLRHARGEALYVDDLPLPPGSLHGFILTSPHAHAGIVRLDATKARRADGVALVLTAADVPGQNDTGPVIHDEPLFAHDQVLFRGQAVALVVGASRELCRRSASLIEVEYAPLPAILSIEEAIRAKSFLSDPHRIARGNVERALAKSALRFSGEVRSGAQDHFYLETHVSLAVPEEGGAVRIACSTQHPSEVQAIVSHVLGIGRQLVTVEVPRMGGGFGGKETQAAAFAAMASLAALRTGRPVKVWLSRDEDMSQTGKRHPFWTTFEAGFRQDGTIQGLKVRTISNGGYSTDLSRAILDRALFHLDNTYFIPALDFVGQVARTHLPSNTAFRGFGGPQGMLVVEEVMNRAAERLGLDPAEVRRKNLYRSAPRDVTPYGQRVKDNRLPRIFDELCARAEYRERRAKIDAFNRSSHWTKRGIAFGAVKFGISFTTSFLNQAGAFLLVYADGTVQMNHGGTEMGQGLHTKMLAVCAHELGIPTAQIRPMVTATDKVPNTSATAASSGADLNGQALREACAVLKERLAPVASSLLGRKRRALSGLVFRDGRIWDVARPKRRVAFAEVADAAHRAQISLAATGYYRTPGIEYDRGVGRGKPFHYFAFGGAVSEVELSGLTGEHRLRRVDILHDVGDSLVPSIDLGQVEGGFIQGLGWLTCEEVLFDAEGRLLTHSPDTYKIPAVGEAPEDFRVHLLERAAQKEVIHGSKAVGEPPLMLAISVVTALRHALASFAAPGTEIPLSIPCTPEAVLRSVEALRRPFNAR